MRTFTTLFVVGVGFLYQICCKPEQLSTLVWIGCQNLINLVNKAKVGLQVKQHVTSRCPGAQ
jgi:hypothetical protein